MGVPKLVFSIRGCLKFAPSTATAQTLPPTFVVVNKGENTLAIVDSTAGRILARIPTGSGPHEVAVSTDGKLAFVSNYGSAAAPGRTISVIDIAARHELHRVNLDPLRRPHGLSFAGGQLYFTAEGSKSIGRHDPA